MESTEIDLVIGFNIRQRRNYKSMRKEKNIKEIMAICEFF